MAHSLGKEMMLAVGLETENLTGNVEGTDLTPAVGKKAVEADRTKLDLIERTGLLALCIDLFVSVVENDLVRLIRRKGCGRPARLGRDAGLRRKEY